MKMETNKRALTVVVVLVLFCTALFQPIVFADEEPVNVTLNGEMLKFDQSPIIENGRTLVPLRKIFESLNAFVAWDEETQTVRANKHGTEISLTIGSNIAKVNGKEYVLDVPAKILNSRTLVPARFVAESLNCKVDWNGDSNTVIIKSILANSENDNLFDIDKAHHGKYIDLDGKIRTNPVYSYSDYIKVTPGETLYFTNYRIPCTVGFVAAYDLDKNAIKDSGKSYVKQYTVPEGTEWITVSADNSCVYWLNISTNNESDGYINEEFYIADGTKITIYSGQLISERRDDLNFTWECDVGNEENENYVIEANGNIGEYPLKVTATDLNGKVIWTGTSIVKIVNNKVPEMTLLAIGDSLTNNKLWESKLVELSGGKISFVGTRGQTIKHEGRSGFTSAGYMKKTEYTFEKEGVHPFWDGERFNWSYYKQTTEVNPDVIQIFLGINGIQNNPESNATNIVKMVNYIKNDDPNIPIFVVNTMYKGPLSDDVEHLKVFNLMETLNQKLNGYENVFIVPVAITHDSANNYAEKDQIHPMDSGYEQIADCIYSSICANIG